MWVLAFRDGEDELLCAPRRATRLDGSLCVDLVDVLAVAPADPIVISATVMRPAPGRPAGRTGCALRGVLARLRCASRAGRSFPRTGGSRQAPRSRLRSRRTGCFPRRRPSRPATARCMSRFSAVPSALRSVPVERAAARLGDACRSAVTDVAGCREGGCRRRGGGEGP